MRQHYLIWIGVCLLVCVLFSAGCQRYGNVDRTTYRYATALYSICNAQDASRLEKFSESIELDATVSEKEKTWLLRIVSLAANGKWDTAEQRARQMLEEQVQF